MKSSIVRVRCSVSLSVLALAGLCAAAATADVIVLNPLPDVVADPIISVNVVSLAGRFQVSGVAGTTLRFSTNAAAPGNQFFVELFDASGAERVRTTPLTAANFMQYVNEGRYDNSMIHRSVLGFVIQGGGYTSPTLPSDGVGPRASPSAIATFGQVQNEPGNTNARGTLGLARLGGQPNSGTSQWFINTANNNAQAGTNLDTIDGGFTVFGRVLGNGMNAVDAMAAIPTYNANSFYGLNSGEGPFGQLPLRNLTNNTTVVQPSQFVTVTSVVIDSGLFSYTVNSSNPLIVSTFISANNQLELRYGGVVGTATVTVRATSLVNPSDFADDAFIVTVREPITCGLADVNSDSVVDGTDFVEFINSFSAGDVNIDSLADVAGSGDDGLSPDGIIDGTDFVAFINAFAVGC